MKYAVYLTIYKGNKLPPFYIGSTSVHKINNGYRGSVTSKLYKSTWKSELINNPNFFETVIIKKFKTRQEAINYEVAIQEKLDVIHNDLYTNTGYFKGRVRYSGPSINKGKSLSDTHKQNISKGRRKFLSEHKNNRFGKPHEESTKIKISKSNREAKRHKFKSINQYDLNGNFIQNFECIRDVKVLLGFDDSNVALCARGKQRTAYGFLWRFA